jgi:hypothetical protein
LDTIVERMTGSMRKSWRWLRRALVETRAQYVTTIRGLVREYGCTLRSCDTEQFVANVRKAKLSVEVRATVEPLIAVLGPLEVQLAAVEHGPIVAASFVSVIDEARRFRTAHQVESYLGLVPSEDTTGGKRRLGAISKQGNSYLRAVLVQAAWTILRRPGRSDPLQRWALDIAERRGNRIAVLALARRLSGVLWAMWRDGTVYDPELVARTGARGLRVAAQSLEFRAAALERAAVKIRRHRTRPAKTTEGGACALAFAEGRWFVLDGYGVLHDHIGNDAIVLVPTPVAAAFDPSGTWLAVCDGNAVVVIDRSTREIVARFGSQ